MSSNKKHSLKKPYPHLIAQNSDSSSSDQFVKKAKYTDSSEPDSNSSRLVSNLLLLSAVCCDKSTDETSMPTMITPLEEKSLELNLLKGPENKYSIPSSTNNMSSSYSSISPISNELQAQNMSNNDYSGTILSNTSTSAGSASSINIGAIPTSSNNTNSSISSTEIIGSNSSNNIKTVGIDTNDEVDTATTNNKSSNIDIPLSTDKYPMRVVFEHNAYTFHLKKQHYFVPFDLPAKGILGNFEGRLNNGDHILSLNDINVVGWSKAKMTTYLKKNTIDTIDFHRGKTYRKEYYKKTSTEKVKSGKNRLACKLYRLRKKLAAVKDEIVSST